jgi:hypothetical protein
MEAHGLNSSAKMWKKMNKKLAELGDIENGGYIDMKEINDPGKNFGFHNDGLFDDDEWSNIKNTINDSKISAEMKQQYMKSMIGTRIAQLDKEGIDVTVAVNFSNNQGDFREQGAELKAAIDFVNQAGSSVDVVAHSMGSLATASYISGISGVQYGRDIDKFVALGPPFKGSILAYPGTLLGKIIPFKPFHEKGPAYHLLQPTSFGIRQLQSAWNNNYEKFGVKAYSLIPGIGDTVVGSSSAWSLNGFSKLDMPFTVHTRESGNKYFQQATYNILKYCSPYDYKPINFLGIASEVAGSQN